MNIELLMDVLASISNANKVVDISKHLTQLHASLQNTISDQSDTVSNAFKSKYGEVLLVLENYPTNDALPSHIKTINEIGGYDFLGGGLKDRLVKMFKENNLTPNIVLAELEKINKEVKTFNNQVSLTYKGLSDFNFLRTVVEKDTFQVLTSIPRKQLPDNLEGLKTEFDSIDKIVRAISEVAEGKGGSPKVILISASEWQVLIELLPASSVLLIIVIEKIVNIFATLWKLKESKDTLVSNNAPQKIIDDLDEHIEAKVQEAIAELSDEIVDEYSQAAEKDKNELKVKLKFRLKDLAQRLDAGTTIEVHTSLAECPTEPEEPIAPEKIEDMSDEEFKKLSQEYKLSLAEYKNIKSEFDEKIIVFENHNRQIKTIEKCTNTVLELQSSHKEPLQISFSQDEEN